MRVFRDCSALLTNFDTFGSLIAFHFRVTYSSCPSTSCNPAESRWRLSVAYATGCTNFAAVFIFSMSAAQQGNRRCFPLRFSRRSSSLTARTQQSVYCVPSGTAYAFKFAKGFPFDPSAPQGTTPSFRGLPSPLSDPSPYCMPLRGGGYH